MASFKLRYSSLFYEDLDKITDYILFELKNELAAKTLVNNVELAIKKCLLNLLGIEPYTSVKTRQYIYSRIIVDNYLIFFVVIDNTLVIRRMLYGRRDINKFL